MHHPRISMAVHSRCALLRLAALACCAGVCVAHGVQPRDAAFRHLAAVHEGAHGKGCGSGHPLLTAGVLAGVPRAVPQAYEQRQRTVRDAHGRALSTTFVNVRNATDVVHLRVALVWDLVEGGGVESDAAGNHTRQCGAVGQVVSVLDATGTSWTPHTCVAEDVVSATPGAAGHERYSVMRQRSEWAAAFWHDALSVKRTADAVPLATRTVAEFGLQRQEVAAADLVVLMAARPSPNIPVAAYARCLQTDQHGRCTVGLFNWVPDVFDVGGRHSVGVQASERQTAVHEVAHLLGAVILGPHWIDADTGHTADVRSYAVAEPGGTPAFPKPTVRIASPRVLALAREAFACPTLTGLPLEDLPLGKGVHWEARVLGPEVMSYGSLAGEEYVSDFTLAMLEDTNQYVANYSAGGRLVDYTAQPLRATAQPVLLAASQLASYPAPPARSPGYPRWGRGAGCDFVDGGPAAWPTGYACRAHRAYGCTADNREGAVCTLVADVTEGETFSCGSVARSTIATPSGSVQQWAVTCETANDNCVDGVCGLPTMRQFFGSGANAVAPLDSAVFAGFSVPGATPGSVGGASSAMDHVPVPVKYWNCGEQQGFVAVSNRSAEEGAAVDASIFASPDSITAFGGQEHCEDCRCFPSSLLEFTKGVDPGLTQFGLCYRANCYREDYLQVGVRSVVAGTTNWYACPPAGGALFIAGYSGSLTCPPAATFCAQEDVSGVRYAESNSVLEWVFLGGAAGVLALALLCLPIPCVRDRLVLCCKRSCAVFVFDENREILLFAKDLFQDERAMWAPEERLATPLRWILGGLGVASVAALGGGGYGTGAGLLQPETAVPALTLATLLAGAVFLGCAGARFRSAGAPCALLSFLVLAVLLAGALAGASAMALVGAGDPRAYVSANWQHVCDVLHGGDDGYCERTLYDTAAREAGIEDAVGAATTGLYVAGGVGLGATAALLVAAGLAAGMVHSDVLIGVGFAATGYTTAALGVAALVTVAFPLASFTGEAGLAVFTLCAALAALVAATAVTGLVGMCRMHHATLVAHFALSIFACLTLALAGGVILALRPTLAGEIERMSAADVARAADGFGFQTTDTAAFGAYMAELAQSVGIASLVAALALALGVLLNALFRREMRIFALEREVRVARQERRLRQLGLSAHFAYSRDEFDVRALAAAFAVGSRSRRAAASASSAALGALSATLTPVHGRGGGTAHAPMFTASPHSPKRRRGAAPVGSPLSSLDTTASGTGGSLGGGSLARTLRGSGASLSSAESSLAAMARQELARDTAAMRGRMHRPLVMTRKASRRALAAVGPPPVVAVPEARPTTPPAAPGRVTVEAIPEPPPGHPAARTVTHAEVLAALRGHGALHSAGRASRRRAVPSRGSVREWAAVGGGGALAAPDRPFSQPTPSKGRSAPGRPTTARLRWGAAVAAVGSGALARKASRFVMTPSRPGPSATAPPSTGPYSAVSVLEAFPLDAEASPEADTANAAADSDAQ